MFEKRLRIIFIVIFILMVTIPLVTTNLQDGKVSSAENRVLASFPKFYGEDGNRNVAFNSDFETWINDNIGMRSEFVVTNAKIQYYLFNVLANNSDMLLGPNGEFNYATEAIIKDYQHLDLKSDETLETLANGFQYAEEYLEERNIQLYYFQCWDKQSIYPEYFPQTVIQYGDISKTDQIVETLTNKTTVSVISPKQELIDGKSQYDTYSKWGDSTHWTQRGSYIGYKKLMNVINNKNDNMYSSLSETDYDISIVDMGSTLFGGIHKVCMLEKFEIKDPKAELTNEKLTLHGDDQRHKFYTNNAVKNKTRVLVLGDSYFNSFIIDDIAESFYETIMIWGDYTSDFENIIDEYEPDILIVENAERCDRTNGFATTLLAIKEKQEKY